MRRSLSKKIALDLGSHTIRLVEVNSLQSSVWELSSMELRSKMIVDAACLVRKKHDQQIVAYGQEALAMRGRLDPGLELIFPFEASHIVDLPAAKQLLKHILHKVFNQLVISPEVMVTTVVAATPFQRQALTQLLYELGFAKVHLIAAPLAAAIGAGVPIADPSGTLLLQMGASTLQCTSIALDSVLFHTQSTCAGNHLDRLIVDQVAIDEQLDIALETAEALKHQVLSFVNTKRTLKIMGKSRKTHTPLELHLKNQDLQAVATLFKVELLGVIHDLLAKLPPELTQDMVSKGIVLSGGLAQLHGLEALLLREFSFPIALLEDADALALMGTAEMLRSL